MAGWMARWHAVLRLVWRDGIRHKGRTVVVVAMIMLPVLAASLLTTAVRSSIETPQTMVQNRLGDSAQALLEDPGCARVTQNPSSGAATCWEERTQPLTPEEMLATVPGGSELVPQYSGAAALRTAETQADVSWLQVDTEALPGLLRTEARADEPGPGEAILATSIAQRLGVGPGDELEILSDEQVHRVVVIGVERPQRSADVLLGDGTIPREEPRADGWLVSGPEPVTWTDLQALNEIGVMVTSRAVLLDPPQDAVVDAHMGYAEESNTQAIGLIGAVAAIGVLEAVLLIGPAFAVGAKRSARQLALVAAGGGRPKDLRRIVLSAGVVAGVLAGVLGAVLGVGAGVAGYFLARSRGAWLPNLVLPTWEVAAAIAVALLLGLAAAWIPARAAARTDVVAALSGRRSEAAPRRRIPWIGVGLTGVGFAVASYGAVVSSPELLIAGVLGIQIGLVMASGALIALAARLAPRLRAPSRFALRDAQRQRGRTAPAVAAVLAAVAGATAGMSYMASESAAAEASWAPNAQDGTGYLMGFASDAEPEQRNEIYTEAMQVVADHGPAMDITEVHGLTEEDGSPWIDLSAQADPDQVDDDGLTEAQRIQQSGYHVVEQGIDDGTWVSATGLPGADTAVAALAEGAVLVNDPAMIWSDGEARIAYMAPGSDYETDEPAVVAWPAHLVEWQAFSYSLILSPQAAEEFDFADAGITTALSGALLSPAEPFEQGQIDALNRALSEVDPNVHIAVEGWQQQGSDDVAVSLILTGLALLIALVATGLSVGLAAAESRPDLATLAAVGANPRMRRRIAGAQAGVISVLGTAVGLVTGLALAYVLSLWQQQGDGWGPLWQFTMPWPMLGLLALILPGMAILGALVLTRSRLPTGRRLAP